MIVKTIEKLFFPLIVSMLSIDLLYLYFSNGWREDNNVIKILEVGLLIIFIIAGFVYSAFKIKSILEVKRNF